MKRTIKTANDKRTKYTTETGLVLLRDWEEKRDGTKGYLPGAYSEFEKNERKALYWARRLSASLIIDRGSDLIEGLAYTSSSAFAAIWNCNTEAHKAGTRLYFRGIALSDTGRAVAIYEERDASGAEIGIKYEIIK